MQYTNAGENALTVPVEENRMVLQLIFSSTQVTIMKEEYIYPFRSLLGEFGGALGMFFGFSFVMIWDLLKMMLDFLLAKLST